MRIEIAIVATAILLVACGSTHQSEDPRGTAPEATAILLPTK
jgi:hypothetical protein